MNNSPDKIKNQKRIEKELDKLKTRFNCGFELKLIFLPGKSRINDYGIPLSGEIQNNIILIYESDLNKALDTLRHEFIEYLIHSITCSYLDIINSQNKIIEKLLYLQREKIINKLTKIIPD